MDLSRSRQRPNRTNAEGVANILRVVGTIDKVRSSADALMGASEDTAGPVGFPEMAIFLIANIVVLLSMVLVGVILASPPLLVVFVPCSILMIGILVVAWALSHLTWHQTRNASLGCLFALSLLTMIVITVPLVNAWFSMHNSFTENHPLPITSFVRAVMDEQGVDPRESSGFFEDVVTGAATGTTTLIDDDAVGSVRDVTKTVFRVFLDTFEFLAAACVTLLVVLTTVMVYSTRASDTLPPSIQL